MLFLYHNSRVFDFFISILVWIRSVLQKLALLTAVWFSCGSMQTALLLDEGELEDMLKECTDDH